MPTILCYGDSNTHGHNPMGPRYDRHTRWAGVMRDTLTAWTAERGGDEYWVVEEGLGGRTTVWDDPIEEHRNGRTYLPGCLMSHKPIDLVIIMLGTNDLKTRFGLSSAEIAMGAGVLAGVVKASGCGPGGAAPRCLLVAPPPVTAKTDMYEWMADAGPRSRLFASHYRNVASACGVDYFDAGSVMRSSEIDGFHFEAEEHTKLGRALAQKVRELLG